MVSTRHHPRPFPEPTLAPSRSPNGTTTSTSTPSRDKEIASPEPTSTKKRSTSTRRKSSANSTSLNGPASSTTTATPSKPTGSSSSLTRTRSTTSSRRKSSRAAHFIHTPTPLAIIWLLFSLPLVIWDTSYVLLRPYSFPGGKLAWPLYKPYGLYGKVDYMYGLPEWKAHNGFTAAQASINVIETLGYIYYLIVVGREVEGGWVGVWEGVRDALKSAGVAGIVKRGDLRVWGKHVEVATLVCFSVCVLTVAKTVLYGLNEAFSNFKDVGHNDIISLIFLWIIPNGAWIVFPAIMASHLGREIVEGLKGVKEE